MLPLNPIWPPMDTPFGHNLVNAWPIFIILLSIIRFRGLQSTGEVFCDDIQSFILDLAEECISQSASIDCITQYGPMNVCTKFHTFSPMCKFSSHTRYLTCVIESIHQNEAPSIHGIRAFAGVTN